MLKFFALATENPVHLYTLGSVWAARNSYITGARDVWHLLHVAKHEGAKRPSVEGNKYHASRARVISVTSLYPEALAYLKMHCI